MRGTTDHVGRNKEPSIATSSTPATTVLVAGVGNIFLGDDGFGCEVVRCLSARAWPPGVAVRDFGVGGIHLAYDLLDGWDVLVLVDAVRRGKAPGTVTMLEADTGDVGSGMVDAHGMDPATVFATLERLGGPRPRTFVVGCEPAATDDGLGLSPEVTAAVEPAAAAVADLVADLVDRDA